MAAVEPLSRYIACSAPDNKADKIYPGLEGGRGRTNIADSAVFENVAPLFRFGPTFQALRPMRRGDANRSAGIVRANEYRMAQWRLRPF
jgi:hypothetical protein